MKRLITFSVLVLSSCLAHAAYMVNYTYGVNVPIPDNSGIGLSDTHVVTTNIN